MATSTLRGEVIEVLRRRPETWMRSVEITQRLRTKRYTSQVGEVCRRLCRDGIAESRKGYGGGYRLKEVNGEHTGQDTERVDFHT